jgi:hypothetical protein
MPTRLDQALALVPGDWSSLRDVIIDLAADVDNLKRPSPPYAVSEDDSGKLVDLPGSSKVPRL